MSAIKIVFYLIMTMAVGGLGISYFSEEGMFTMNHRAKAQKVIEEANDVDQAMETYALTYGDGKVDFGNVADGEELLVYLKDKQLVKNSVGRPDGEIEDWILNEAENSLEKVVSNDNTCKYINQIKHKRPLEEDTPECGTADAEGISCCFNP